MSSAMSAPDRESKATQNYLAFNLIRSRFGSPKKPQPLPQRKEKRKRRDPRFEAPPLKPLVEEGDLTPAPDVVTEVESTCPSNNSTVENQLNSKKILATIIHDASSLQRETPCGALKYATNYPYKSATSVLNELESAETASQSSQSSAYFSLTSTLGSVTELSDTASTDSFNEYDFKSGAHATHLCTSFEHLHRNTSVRHHTTGIGRSKTSPKSLIHRLQRPCSAGSERPSSIGFKTSSTPQAGSLENILNTSSKTSLLSIESDNSDCMRVSDVSKYKPGKFVSSQTSNDVTGQGDHDQVEIVSRRVSVREVSSPQLPELVIVEERDIEKQYPEPIAIKSNQPSNCAWACAQHKYKLMRQRSMVATCCATHKEDTGTKKEPGATDISISIIEERARTFGGMKKSGMLRQIQSFKIEPCHLVNTNTYY